MSRHRNVRSLNYHEECDGMDDVYGHSFDDTYSVSPGTIAQFSFDRNRHDQLSSFFSSPEEIIREEDEIALHSDSEENIFQDDINDSIKNQLNSIDKAKLESCIEQMRNIIGKDMDDINLETIAYKANFDPNVAINFYMDNKAFDQSTSIALNNKLPSSQSNLIVSLNKIPSDQSGAFVSNLNTNSKKSNAMISKPELKAQCTPPNTKNSKKFNGKSFANELLDFGADENILQTPKKEPAIEGLTKSASRAKLDKLDVLKEYEKRKNTGKDCVNLVVIGHVDAGKSTLMGHLLFQLGLVSKKTMHKHETEAKKIGKSSFAFAWVFDETDEERTRGVTMDIAQRHFETTTKKVTLIDAPGHKDFIPNMITGAAQADVAILVVNATTGEFETGFETGGQTREHALLARSLGVSYLIVAINKMDTVNWSEHRYNFIIEKLTQFLKQAGYKEVDLIYIPCSGLAGLNLVQNLNEVAEAQWYKGRTLIEEIDLFKAPERAILDKALRLCITDVFRGIGSGLSIAGNIQVGSLQVGDRVVVAPSGETGTVKSITMDDNQTQISFAGDNIIATIIGVDDNKISIGCVLCDPSSIISSACNFRARIVIFNIDVPITRGYSVILHMQSLCEQVRISKLFSQLHRMTGEVIKKNPKCLVKNSTAEVEISCQKVLCLELYSEVRELGRFMLRSGGHTIAAGVVIQIL